MNRSLYKLLPLFLIILSFSISCKQKINVTIPFNADKPVLNCIMQKDSLLYVRVTKPLPVLSYKDNFEEIKNAKIELYENDVFKEILTEKKIGEKLYYTSVGKAELNKTYSLKASGDFSKIETFAKIPSPPEILSAKYIPSANNTLKILLKIKDEKNVKNFYSLQVYAIDREDATKRIATIFTLENLKEKGGGIFDDFKEPDLKYEWVFNDFEFDGKDEFTLILADISQNGNEVPNYYAELSTISEDYYKYLKSLSKQSDAESDPIQEKVVVHTNIKGGLGIFAAKNKVRKKVEP